MVQGSQSTLPNATDLHPAGEAAGAGAGLNLPAANLGTQSASALDLAPHPGAGTPAGGAVAGTTGGTLNSAGVGPGGALPGGLLNAGGKGNGFGMSPLSGIGQRSAADMRTQASGLGTMGARPFGGPHSMNGVSGLGGPSMLGGRRGAGALGAGSLGAGARGMMPMMGARGGDSAKSKKVKSVVTQVELEPNKKALLGESPLVVPGVIGAWVRE